MADKKKRPSRLGRGLSSLMGTPADLPAVPVEADPAKPHPPTPTPQAPARPAPADTAGAAPEPAHPPSAEAKEEPGTGRADPQPAETAEVQAVPGLVSIDVLKVSPNKHQPRQQFSEQALEGLSASIQRDGLMQPVVVRPDGQGGYELIAGERRWRAAQLAGLSAIPAILHEVDDERSAQWALVENLQREDLNPMEKAEAFKRLADGFGLPHAEIAERVGLERSTVSNLMRLLNLSDFCRGLVREELLSMGQARAIAGLPDPAHQKQLAQRAVREGLSVRQVEQAARKFLQNEGNAKPAAGRQASKSNLADLERQIGQQLGTRVRVKAGRKKGSGTLAIDFFSLEEFDALLARMKVDTE
jgi:ParB family chromosome partitioning protein